METKTLLLVEDDGEFSEILQRRFCRRGLDVVIRETPEEAFQATQVQDFHVAIVDGSLRGRDGVELVRNLKQKCPSLPCIMLSGNSSDQAIARAFSAGVSMYLLKPCSLQELEDAINEVCEKNTDNMRV